VTAHRQAGWLVAAAVALTVMLAGGRQLSAPAAASSGAIPAERVAAPLGFAASVPAGERELVRAAIAAARPEARALIERVDGLVTVSVGVLPGGNAGLTQGNLDGYEITLDLAGVSRANGPRGISRLVLHELGHVVDHALLDAGHQRALDAGIPAGYSCAAGESTSGCAPREERFAETFAKWASNDIGINIWLGYKVLPPPSLDTWGAGLAGV
jgi:hypothetical protein